MPSRFRFACFIVCALLIPLSATAQLNLIQLVPDQSDDEWGMTGQSVIEAANGDVLVIYGKNGEVTDSSSFPFEGLPATIVLHRKTKGLFWEPPVILDTAIENGIQSAGSPKLALLPDGRILLTYFYHDALAPNFSFSIKVLISSDNGMTWQPLNSKDRESAALTVTPAGTVVSLDWVDDGSGRLSFHSSSYQADSDSWSPNGFIASTDEICTMTLHAESETEWHFYFSDCVFGYGGTNKVFRKVSMDAGASWGDSVELFTADSGVGGTLGSIVATGAGKLTAVYSNGVFISYRTSNDGGANWSEAMDWTGNTAEYGDISPQCAASQGGPLCIFLGRRDTINQLVHVGIAGRSGDPLLGVGNFALNAGFNDAWFNPVTAGQGFLISVFPEIQQVFVAWFTFDTERPPESVEALLGEPGHRWLTAQGPFEGDSATLTIYVTKGGVFDSPEPAVEVDPAGDGTLILEFTDCYQGLITYEITSLNLSGAVPIERVANDNVTLCEELSGY